MRTLSAELRASLERTVREARRVAESGSKKALEALDVASPAASAGLGKETQTLRRRLRAHARLLGDLRDASTGSQPVARLVREIAYQHWHRMLFARFLAENGLLLEPTRRVAVTLEEVEDMARENGQDKWLLAASYAERMLPAIFDTEDPSLALALPPETRQALEGLLSGLQPDVFRADDALGWTYQFWQSDEKARVNDSGEAIGADELPAVTQLFTEHYMVEFLLHNTIGAWHAAKVLSLRPELLAGADSEEVLRAAIALPGYTFDYLRFARAGETEDGPWQVGAGANAAWPRAARDLSVLDPCCGSGHFLVAAFDLLVRLRMQEEGLGLRDAIPRVLRENLFGLELDARCVQLAAFAVAFHAWKWLGEPLDLPRLHIACCGLTVGTTREDWLRLAGAELRSKEGMSTLFDLFAQAPVLGSLIDPERMVRGDLLTASLNEVGPMLLRALEAAEGPEGREAGIVARGMLDAAALLQRKYTIVVTNPPYLGRGKQGAELVRYADLYEAEARQDLATVFLSRALRWCDEGGVVAMVLPQTWLFLTRYVKLRQRLLRERTWNFMVWLGEHAFESAEAAGALAALVAISCVRPVASSRFLGLDASNRRGEAAVLAAQKAELLRGTKESRSRPCTCLQASILADPNAVLTLVTDRAGDGGLMREKARSFLGLGTGDFARHGRHFWELQSPSDLWRPFQGPVEGMGYWGGGRYLIAWDQAQHRVRGLSELERAQIHNQDQSGQQAWGRSGVAVNLMGRLRPALYFGCPFDKAVAVLVPRDATELGRLWRFCNRPEFEVAVRRLDRNVMCSNGALERVWVAESDWEGVNAPTALLPEPQTNDPADWLFHGHPAGTVASGAAFRSPLGVGDPTGVERDPVLTCRVPNMADVLQVAVARIVGYRWPSELDASMRLDMAAREWANRSGMLTPFRDDDGLVPIPALHGKLSAAERVHEFLRAAFGMRDGGGSTALVAALLAASRSTSTTLDAWLRSEFFVQHCALFGDLPFVWHIWDGRDDGFHVLVHYHRLAAPDGRGRRVLEKVTHTYLGEWIGRQRAECTEGRDGADARLDAALRLQQELEAILMGESPYDLFVRWKPLSEQPVGWEPDINDGVRLNIRPFLLAKDVRNRGAGVLRARPSIKWGADPGRDPEGLRPRPAFPWSWGYDPENPAHQCDFTGGGIFDGKRRNDLHYSLKAKRATRQIGGVA